MIASRVLGALVVCIALKSVRQWRNDIMGVNGKEYFKDKCWWIINRRTCADPGQVNMQTPGISGFVSWAWAFSNTSIEYVLRMNFHRIAKQP